ncbi:hypothetical protein [Niabella hirudinis]|uniref:hypothetical protein n=1 Tax=Niabella hirudinis TaxID=1285929 RepID=UPI003EB7AB37
MKKLIALCIAHRWRICPQSEGDSAIFKYDGFAAGAGAGVALFLKNNISLDLGTHYTYTQLENIQKRGYYVKNNGLGFLAGFSLFF